MAKNIFLDQLNNRELMESFGIQQENAPLTPEELVALSTPTPVPTPTQKEVTVTPQVTPKKKLVKTEQKSKNTENSNVDNEKASIAKEDILKETEKELTPLERYQALMEQYRGEDQANLEKARNRDRMLKIGGVLGDALATYINARGQKNVMAPGVQVQQGAGLGKVADMFATSPEIASDVKARREAMLKQYSELAKGERAGIRLKSEEQRAKAADLRARELAEMQIEGNLKAAAIKAYGGSKKDEELTPYQEMMKEERQIQKQEKDLKALKEIETRKRAIEDNIERAKALVTASGTFEMFGPESEELNSIIDEISVDMAKLQDPDSVARPTEVALVRKNLIPEGPFGKLGMSNETAIKLLNKFKDRVNERAKIGYQVRGIKAPEGEEAVKPNQKQQQSDYEPKIDKVLKANPGASRQQVIEALKKDKKLPEDYK